MSYVNIHSSDLTDFEVKLYMYGLFKILDYSHSKGIMHRNIQPDNLVIAKDIRAIKLLNWNNAEFYHQGNNYST